MRRIAIPGGPGSGKSIPTRLGVRPGLPVIHLDTPFRRPGWTLFSRHAPNVPVTRLRAAREAAAYLAAFR